MYELRQLPEVWPTLRGCKSLKALLQDHYAHRTNTSLNVWVHPGHVIVAHGQTVLSFDVLPRSKHVLDSAGSSLYTKGDGDPDWLCLSDCAAPLVNVFCPGEDHSLAGLVFSDGKVEFWRFQRPEYRWTATNFIHLMTTEPMHGHERMAVSSVTWLEDRKSLLVCYSTPRSFSSSSVVGEKPASNRFSVGEWALNDTFQAVTSYRPVLTRCPTMAFTCSRGLVCCEPKQVTLSSLLLLWVAGKSVIQPHLCGSEQNHRLPESACPVDFTDLVARIVGLWLTETAPPEILSVTPYRWTNEILVLLHDGRVLVSRLQKGLASLSPLFALQPWPCADSINADEDKTSGRVTQMLAQRSCLVLVQSDMPLRVFDVRSGQQLWHSIDMQLADSHTSHLWQLPTSAATVGAWNRSGLYVLQSKAVLSQAESMLTLSDGNDLPEEDAVTRCCRAARLCLDWNQHAAANRFSLQGASLVGQVDHKDGAAYQKFPEELVQLLDVAGLESPALLLPALVKFPAQRQYLISKVALYLRRYKSDTDTVARLLRSSLGEDIVPLLEEYLSLTQQYTDLLSSSTRAAVPSAGFGDVHSEVLSLVDSQSVISGSVEASQARLDLLAESSPLVVLATLREFLDVPDFNEALPLTRQDALQSSVNWEAVLVRDNAFLQTADVLVTSRFPLFELLCRLLYKVTPEELVAFVEFAGLVLCGDDEVDAAFVHHDKEHYFVQHALAALPVQFPDGCPQKVPSAFANDSETAVTAHAQLLMKSGRSQCGMMAIRYLISRQLWPKVFEFLKSILSEESDSAQSLELFHVILVSLMECNQLHRYHQAIMKLRPSSFTLTYFLALLQKYVSAPTQSQLDSSGFLVSDPNGPLTVDVIRGMLLSMMA